MTDIVRLGLDAIRLDNAERTHLFLYLKNVLSEFRKNKYNMYIEKTDVVCMYSLLLEVEKSTGFPVLLNTSFNRPGEPIVESPSDALASFAMGSLDYLFLENVLISR